MSKAKWLSVALGTTAMAAVMAATPAQADRLESLQRQIDALQDQVIELKAGQKAAPEGDCIKWKFDPAPQFGTCDGKFEANLRGRLMLDAGFVEDDTGALDVEATEARRARLGIEGKAWKVFKYKFEVDFSDGAEIDVTDAYMQYKGKDLGGLTVLLGQAKQTNSLEEQTSSRFVTFSERAAFTDAFEFSRQLGIIIGYANEFNNVGYKLDLGAYRGAIGAAGSESQQGRTLSARLATWTKMNDNLFHFGGSVRSRSVGETQDEELEYEQRPFIHATSRRVVGGEGVPYQAYNTDLFYGVEGAWQWDAFHVQGEWTQLNANGFEGGGVGPADATFGGWYVDAGYFLGGKRGYKKGKFGRPKVDNPVGLGGWGALQLAYRYDTLDLSDSGFNQGELTQHIIAVNWWLNRHALLSFNYANGDIENLAAGVTDIDPNASGNNGFDAFNVRAQIDW